jgi:predicted nucleic acid-binding protein
MIIVVSDTTPLNYLVLMGLEELLPSLFDRVVVPKDVHRELSAAGAPFKVREWAESCPAWLEVWSAPLDFEIELDAGEEAAIALARELSADLLLMDEVKGRRKAGRKGLKVTGTLGILLLAAERGAVDLHSALDKLAATSAFVSADLMAAARAAAAKLERARSEGIHDRKEP